MEEYMNDFFKRYDYLFFDFDGVIVDSVDIKTKAFAKLFEEYGKDVVRKVIEYHIQHTGISRYEKFRYYYQNYLNKNITEEEIKILDKKFSEFVYGEILKAPFIPGVIDFLNTCYSSKKTMFIVSATPQEEIKNIIREKKITNYFKHILGSPLTKEENVKYLIIKYNINPLKAVYFGDSPSDKKAAEKNNIFFIPINYSQENIGFKDFNKLITHLSIKNA